MYLIKLWAALTWVACVISGLLFVTMFMPWLLVFALPVVFLSLGGINANREEE